MVPQRPLFRLFPSRPALLLLVTGVALYFVLGGLLLVADRNAHRFRQASLQVDTTIDAVRRDVEATNSLSLLAASTGEQVFVVRHAERRRHLETSLDSLQRSSAVVEGLSVRGASLREHVRRVMAVQDKALGQAAKYDLETAWSTLRGIEYEATLTEMLACLDECDAAVEAFADASLTEQGHYTTAALWCIALFAPAFLIMGLALVRRAYLASRDNASAQLALAESERRFRGTFEQAAVGIAHVGLDGTFLRVNDRYCGITGYGQAELTRRTFADITHADDLETDRNFMRRLLAGEIGHYAMDKRYLTKAGVTVWVTLTVTLERDDDGKPLYYISVIQDISARKAAEAAAAESVQTVRALLDATSDRVLLADASGRILAVNAASAKGLGMAAPDLVGRYFHDVFPNQLATTRLARLRESMESGVPVRFADEREGVVFDNIVAPLPGPGGRVATAALFARDATEIIRARQAAEAASAAKTNFLANISHELRTPLNGILGMAQVLAGTPLSEDQRQCLDDVTGASRSLMALVDDLIELSAIEAGAVVPVRLPFVLASVLEALRAELTPVAVDKGLAFSVTADSELPQLLVGDGERLGQVLERLIGNALKFTKQGSVAVTIDVVGSESPDEGDRSVAVLFAVRDTGIGVAPEDRGRIFESFTQADGSVTRTFGGTGLGLAISARLVRLMGGEIELESEPGQGSCFYFTLRFDLPGNLLDSDDPI